MCPKLIIAASVCACCLATAGCGENRDLKYREGSRLDKNLIVADNEAQIEANIAFREKHLIRAGQSKFAFYTGYPYRGLPTDVLYCYEQVGDGTWILRGLFPVTAWDFRRTTSGINNGVEFAAYSNSVDVLCNKEVIMTIKPQP